MTLLDFDAELKVLLNMDPNPRGKGGGVNTRPPASRQELTVLYYDVIGNKSIVYII